MGIGLPFSAKMTLKDGYGFGGFSGTPPSEPNLSRPTPPPQGQVEISFLGMPQIAHFEIKKNEKAPTVGGEHPPPPARSLRSRGLGRFAPSQRLHPKISFGSLRHCMTVNTNSKFAVCCKFGPCIDHHRPVASIHFSDWGAKFEKCQKIWRALRARSQSKIKIVYV